MNVQAENARVTTLNNNIQKLEYSCLNISLLAPTNRIEGILEFEAYSLTLPGRTIKFWLASSHSPSHLRSWITMQYIAAWQKLILTISEIPGGDIMAQDNKNYAVTHDYQHGYKHIIPLYNLKTKQFFGTATKDRTKVKDAERARSRKAKRVCTFLWRVKQTWKKVIVHSFSFFLSK